MKIIYSETEILKIFDIQFKKNWIFYDLLKIKDQKNPQMNTLV